MGQIHQVKEIHINELLNKLKDVKLKKKAEKYVQEIIKTKLMIE